MCGSTTLERGVLMGFHTSHLHTEWQERQSISSVDGIQELSIIAHQRWPARHNHREIMERIQGESYADVLRNKFPARISQFPEFNERRLFLSWLEDDFLGLQRYLSTGSLPLAPNCTPSNSSKIL